VLRFNLLWVSLWRSKERSKRRLSPIEFGEFRAQPAQAEIAGVKGHSELNRGGVGWQQVARGLRLVARGMRLTAWGLRSDVLRPRAVVSHTEGPYEELFLERGGEKGG
jgi:hypothetical protein